VGRVVRDADRESQLHFLLRCLVSHCRPGRRARSCIRYPDAHLANMQSRRPCLPGHGTSKCEGGRGLSAALVHGSSGLTSPKGLGDPVSIADRYSRRDR
jgi:hypothetical protein